MQLIMAVHGLLSYSHLVNGRFQFFPIGTNGLLLQQHMLEKGESLVTDMRPLLHNQWVMK